MTTIKEAHGETPLYIQPVADLCSTLKVKDGSFSSPSGDESFVVLYRKVFAHPCHPEGSIETVIEQRADKHARHDEIVDLRVVVYSGPESAQRCILAQYTCSSSIWGNSIDTSTFSSPHCVAWTTFADDPNHLLLCVLVNPTMVYIYDVFPESKFIYCSGAGHGVSLPFAASGIFTLPSPVHGLLISRSADMQDHEQSHLYTKDNDTVIVLERDSDNHLVEGSDVIDDDGFFLQPPPRLSRQQINIESGNRLSDCTADNSLASLFVLTHPLLEVLPILLANNDSTLSSKPTSLVTDALEQVVWTGVIEWQQNPNKSKNNKDDYNNTSLRQFQRQPILITHHLITKQHAVWIINSVSAPPISTAGYPGITLGNMNVNQSSDYMLWDDVPVLFDDLFVPDAATPYQKRSRTSTIHHRSALASALGVRTSETGTNANTAYNNTTPHVGRIARPSLRGGHYTDRSVLLSPKQQGNTRPSSPEINDLAATSFVSTNAVSNATQVSIQLIFQDETTSEEFAEVFLVSNLENTGTLVLCFYQPHVQTIYRWGVDPITWEFERLTSTFNCKAVQQLQGVTHCSDLGPSRELLLLHKDCWKLYRSYHEIVSCQFPYVNHAPVIQDSISNRITVRCNNQQEKVKTFRSLLSLKFECSLAEQVLQVWDAVLYQHLVLEDVVFSLALRSDALRLSQHLKDTGFDDNPEWLAVTTIWIAIVEIALLGQVAVFSKSSIISHSSNSEWEQLLQSDFHLDEYELQQSELLVEPIEKATRHCSSIEEAKKILIALPSKFIALVSSTYSLRFADLFMALHHLYEEVKLSVGRDAELLQLSRLTCYSCMLLEKVSSCQAVAQDFLLYYLRDIGTERFQRNIPLLHDEIRNLNVFKIDLPKSPPSLERWIESKLRCLPARFDYEQPGYINNACTKTRSLVKIYNAFFLGKGIMRDKAVVESLLEENYNTVEKILDEITPGFALPLLEVIHRCRYDTSLVVDTRWSSQAWYLVGREDLANNIKRVKHFTIPKIEDQNGSDTGNNDVDIKEWDSYEHDPNGLVQVEHRSAMLFPNDNRVHEASRLLNSSKPMFLRVPRTVGVSDHDYEKMKQNRLMLLSRRTFALPIGRGMLTLGSLSSVVSEALPIPDICLKGRLPPTNASLALDTGECPPDYRLWPDFHNGVAAGLRLSLNSEISGASQITRTWIVYNRPPLTSQSPSHQDDGNIDSNPQVDSKMHAHGGLLLALGLCGHLKVLEMSDLYDYLTQGAVTTTVGVLLGMAATMKGTCDMAVSKMLCLHISSLIPQHFSAIDVASTVQSAAIIGAGLLYQGSSHRMMTEFLINEIGKRPDNDIGAQDRESYNLACGIALGMVNLSFGDEKGDNGRVAGIADLKIEERLCRYIHGGEDDSESRRARESNDRFSAPSSTTGNDGDRCSLIHESEAINVDVTAPGATLALGLMYMKSGNKFIAAALLLPQTHFLLEFIRPDFLTLRVVSKSLILWDEVRPTRSWIDEQLPMVVRQAYSEMKKIALNALEGKDIVHRHFDYDRRAVRQIYVHVVSGACFGLALRYAGTCNKDAKNAITERVKELNSLREGSDPVTVAVRPEPPILETCLGTAAISLALVMAGSGDLDTLRILKALRWRCDVGVRYGFHMTYAMAIGLLFLGGGQYTVGRDPADIAALLMAFFPRYPMFSTDNQFHLQALRHMYALAVYRREVCAVDVDSNEAVYVQVQAEREGKQTKVLSLPALIYNSDHKLRSLTIASKEFYPLSIKIRGSLLPNVFYVKRKMAYAHHSQVPLKMSIKYKLPIKDENRFAGMPYFAALTKYMNRETGNYQLTTNCFARHHHMILFRTVALQSDSGDTLALYLSMLNVLQLISSDSFAAVKSLKNLRLILQYYNCHLQQSDKSTVQLLRPNLLAYLNNVVEQEILSSPNVDLYAVAYFGTE